MTLCRRCHRNIHEGHWRLIRSPEGIQVVDKRSGQQVMRRLSNPGLDAASLLHLLNTAEDSLSRLMEALPFLTDDQLVEAFAYARSLGKRSWLIQAAILYEAQQRSSYGQHALEAIARRFDISLRQAQKYALVWKLFFASDGQVEAEGVNVDAFFLDEPSWYVVAASETKDPYAWLAYAQDRKVEDPRYSVAAFRRDIRMARLREAAGEAREAMGLAADDKPERWRCPWVRAFCIKSGTPVPVALCTDCLVGEQRGFCETKPNVGGASDEQI